MCYYVKKKTNYNAGFAKCYASHFAKPVCYNRLILVIKSLFVEPRGQQCLRDASGDDVFFVFWYLNKTFDDVGFFEFFELRFGIFAAFFVAVQVPECLERKVGGRLLDLKDFGKRFVF